MNTSRIPKIIHHTGPSDKSKWHPLWDICYQSFKDNFEDFQFMYWNDEDIDKIVEEFYPQYLDVYNMFPLHIMKVDFARFCILHKYGGIYADLDVFCYKNFYDFLEKDVYFVESMNNDPFENSIMCSVPGHNVMMECCDESVKRFYHCYNRDKHGLYHTNSVNAIQDILVTRSMFVLYLTGPSLVSCIFGRHYNIDKESTIGILPVWLFNNYDDTYHEDFFANHIHTGLWGKENIEVTDFSIQIFEERTKQKVDNFNFYSSEKNKKIIKENNYFRDFFKNNVDWDLNVSLDYNYE